MSCAGPSQGALRNHECSGAKGPIQGTPKLFVATDIHRSDRCVRKSSALLQLLPQTTDAWPKQSGKGADASRRSRLHL